jgi:hypothetical protein
MRRWLLTLFALQFFCSVSAFAYADTGRLAPSSPGVGMAAEASKGSTDMTLKLAASALDPTHGLLDDIPELPELPECLDVAMGQVTVATPWDLPRDRLIAEWKPPALDGPQRPPRSHIALA